MRTIVAESHDKGKGREKKKFVSDKRELYFSIVIDEEIIPHNLFFWRITAASIYKVLKQSGIDTFFK